MWRASGAHRQSHAKRAPRPRRSRCDGRSSCQCVRVVPNESKLSDGEGEPPKKRVTRTAVRCSDWLGFGVVVGCVGIVEGQLLTLLGVRHAPTLLKTKAGKLPQVIVAAGGVKVGHGAVLPTERLMLKPPSTGNSHSLGPDQHSAGKAALRAVATSCGLPSGAGSSVAGSALWMSKFQDIPLEGSRNSASGEPLGPNARTEPRLYCGKPGAAESARQAAGLPQL